MTMLRNWCVRPAIALTTAVVIYGCESEHLPTRPSEPQAPPAGGPAQNQCGTPSYTISGLVSGEGNEPLAGAYMVVVPYESGRPTTTQTDSSGHYSVCGPSATKVAIRVSKDLYATVTRPDVPARDQTVDLVLPLRFQAPSTVGTLTGVIRGDELGGDPFFGKVCGSTPCKIVDFRECPCPRQVEITLRWADPSSQLALYFSNADVYLPPIFVRPATRICCSSPSSARYTFNFDFDRFLIGFEQALGAPPGPHDSQTFELTIRPIG